MSEQSESEQHTILVVEDEDAIRLTVRDYLIKLGFTVVVASDGVGAIKQLLDHPVDVIVSDYRMDLLGGDYWVRFLRRFCPDTPVLVTSGFLKPDIDIPFDVVYKPFNYAEIAARIGDHLANRGSPAEGDEA